MNNRVVYTSIFGGYDGISNVFRKRIVYPYTTIVTEMLKNLNYCHIDICLIMNIVFG